MTSSAARKTRLAAQTPSLRAQRRGVYFTLDGVFAAIIIVTAVALWLSYTPRLQDSSSLHNTATDAVTVLNSLQMKEINTPLAAQVLATNLTNENDTALRAIGVLWATNNPLAQSFTQEVLSTFIPQYSWGVYAEGALLANRTLIPQSQALRVATAKQQISGIAQSQPVTGSTATAFLKKIENKTTSSFVTFGGFVGQGNLTFLLTGLPSDISPTMVKDVLLEVDTPLPITLRINGHDCGTYTPVNFANATPDTWNIPGCNDQFIPGTNLISIAFTGNIDENYLAGGFLRVRYTTNEEIEDPYATPKIVRLPGIEGVVNLYDAFYVPGNVSSVTISLHYFANHSGALASNPFYITIGNTTVFRENYSNTTQTIVLTDVNLTSLNYSLLSQRTVPFRIGFENLSFSATYTGNADVLLVTDNSGSMQWRMDQDNVNGVARVCTSPILNNSDTQRISVAKCLDIQFVTDILNYSGNKMGLVAYDDATITGLTVPLTTNFTRLNSTISSYTPGASTCICCGINSAVAELNRSILRTFYVTTGASWKYAFGNGSLIAPGDDAAGNHWYDPTYANESTWSSNVTVIGSAENGTGPAIVGFMPNTLGANRAIPDLWDMQADNGTPEVDFTSGLNSTGNTFGVAGANDGWDWQGGVYGYSSQVAFGWAGGGIQIYTNTTADKNNCAGSGTDDCSGAFGIPVNITAAMWSMLQNNGFARVSFGYSWTSKNSNPFENSDEVWIKARWTNASGNSTYLGTERSSQGSDTTVEIDSRNNPNTDFSGSYANDITGLITGPGVYYLDVGGKLLADNNNGDDEWGTFRFDNILVSVENQSDVYYLRKNFTIPSMTNAQTLLLNVLSDDRATIYVNGQLLVDEPLSHTASYWDVHGVVIPQALVHTGVNTIAARLENFRGAAKFDAQVIGLNTSRNLAMLVMTDGQANDRCDAEQGTGNALSDAILAACQARENWGISVHTVGFSAAADNVTLAAAAACGGGLFASSANATELGDFYRNVAFNILDSSVKSQSILLNGSFQRSILFNDSYLSFVHTPANPPLQTNEISVRTQTPPLSSCTPTVFINPTARILTSQLTSYSGDHWTDLVTANGNTVYNLSTYSSPYIVLGDPFVVEIPPAALTPGSNTLLMRTGDSPSNGTGCSNNNSLITTLALQLSTAYTPVLSQAVGCQWLIEHDDGSTQSVAVPATYVGGNACSYTNASIAFNGNDAYDVAVYNLMRTLDYDLDGRIFISLSEEDIEIIVSKVSNVPYLWGPSIFEVRVWQ